MADKKPEHHYSAVELQMRELMREKGIDPDAPQSSTKKKKIRRDPVMGYKTYISHKSNTSGEKATKDVIEHEVRTSSGYHIQERFHCCLCLRAFCTGYEYSPEGYVSFKVCCNCRNSRYHGKALTKDIPHPFRN